MIAVYVTGHGFGHATRTAETLRAIRAMDGGVPITVCTSAPAFLFESQVLPPLTVRRLACDVGLVQRDALVIDEAATVEKWSEFQRGQAQRVETEARWLRESGARLVIGDVPPLAFEAAAAAGVPSLAITNFSWDWIYRHLSRRHQALTEAADVAAAAYRNAQLLLQLPFAGDLSAFQRREPLPLVARRARVGGEEARARIGASGDRMLVLVSFGGLGLPGLDPARFAATPECDFVIEPCDGVMPRNVFTIGPGQRAALGLEYPDLVAAADVVLTKPGYGIVSDCIAGRTRLVYTDRGDFPEYPVMVEEMPDWLPCRYVSQETLFSGAIQDVVDDVTTIAWPPARATDGASVAAERALALLR